MLRSWVMRAIFSTLIVAAAAICNAGTAMAAPAVTASSSDLYTNVYVVPPTFLHSEAPLNDPFKSLRPAPQRKTAKQILAQAGLTFGEGASAIYNPATSQLIVRNTQDQMELVEAYIESITQGVEKQIYVTINEVQFDEKALKEGWMDDVRFGGNKIELDDVIKTSLELPPLPKAAGKSRTMIFDSPDTFRKEFSRPPSIPSNQGERVGRKISGVLTDPQFQVLIRALNQRKEVDLQNLPSVMCRSGQLAMVQKNDKRYGVQAVLGADEYTVDLRIFLPLHGEPLFGELDAVSTPHQVTIWDGQTVVIAERREKGDCRLVFVKAQIMDPAGLPIRGRIENKAKEQKPKKEGKAPKVMVTPEFQDTVKRADNAALRGSQLMADGDYKNAGEKYAEALRILPKDEMTVPRRNAYEKQLARAQEQMKPIFADSLKTITIPKINFRDVPLDDALGQILVLIHKHADRGLFPDFNPRISLTDAEVIGTPKITLRLSNVPVSEALRYVTSLAQCQYRIEDEVIVVEPLSK